MSMLAWIQLKARAWATGQTIYAVKQDPLKHYVAECGDTQLRCLNWDECESPIYCANRCKERTAVKLFIRGSSNSLMKKLKFDHEQAQKVLRGEVTTCWRVFDDKDLSVNDSVVCIDKVDTNDPSSWRNIGTATITSVMQKRLKDLTDLDLGEYARFRSEEAMLATLKRQYGADVMPQTPVKIVHFDFSTDLPSKKTQILSKIDKAVIYADGGSRGNPGPSASGYVIFDTNGTMLVQRGIYLGITTNNKAEYTALKLGLEEAKSLNVKEVEVYMDSMLVVNQMKGVFKVKNRDLRPIHEAIKLLCSQFRHVTFTQVPRAMNKLADAAVNRALDEELAGS